MTAIKLKSLLIAAGISTLSASVLADISTDKTVVNSANGNATITVSFPTPVHGDLYLAAVVNGEYLFFSNQGRTVSKTVAPFQSDSDFNTAVKVLEVSSAGIPPNTYPFYQVVTLANSDPLNFNNWIGGLGGLHKLNFTIGLTNSAAGDSNNDGFIDNDFDHDGYADVASQKCSPNVSSRDRKHDNDDDSNEKNDDRRHPSSTPQVTAGSNSPSSTCTPSTPQVTTPFADLTSASPTPTKLSSTSTTTSSTSGLSTSTSTNTVGLQLYNSNCKSCHTPASMKGRSASRITSAIGSVGPMRPLSGLSTSEIQAIANYLVAP